MPRAVEVLHEKVRTAVGIVVEFKVWRVRDQQRYPEGFKYSFFAVRHGVVLVGYDNHPPKGHHRHFAGEQEPYAFEGLEKLRATSRETWSGCGDASRKEREPWHSRPFG